MGTGGGNVPFPEEILFEGRPVGGGGGGSRIWGVVGTVGLSPGIGGTRLDLLAGFIALTGDAEDNSLEPIFGFRELYSVVGDCGT
jgi:hypothetical protein